MLAAAHAVLIIGQLGEPSDRCSREYARLGLCDQRRLSAKFPWSGTTISDGEQQGLSNTALGVRA